MRPAYYVTLRYLYKDKPHQVVVHVTAKSGHLAKDIALRKLPKGSVLVSAIYTQIRRQGKTARDPGSRLLFEGEWPDTDRAKSRAYKAVWLPQKKVAIIYERADVAWRLDTKLAKKRGVMGAIVPESSPKQWRVWGTYPLADFRDMRELMGVVKSDLRYESNPHKHVHHERVDTERELRVALMGRGKAAAAIARFAGKAIRAAQRAEVHAINGERESAFNEIHKAETYERRASRLLDGFSDKDSAFQSLKKQWHNIHASLIKARKAMDRLPERDLRRFRTSKKSFGRSNSRAKIGTKRKKR
jgi:hypothetical protein